MSRVLLDIGAGDSSFVSNFLIRNPGLCRHFLCGEPRYPCPWKGPSWWRRVHHVRARYEFFEVDDGILDFVTLNAYHPFMPPRGIVPEVIRCLRPGGIFISAHPVGHHPRVVDARLRERSPEGGISFERVNALLPWYEARFEVESIGIIRYPASPTIVSRLLWLKHPELYQIRVGRLRVPRGA